ncbi:MAG: two-component sensor histidine kinase [Elusimicrobia bacterium]|nr:two-component sensor histidine kinase [Elusimicrobiota bacterium]
MTPPEKPESIAPGGEESRYQAIMRSTALVTCLAAVVPLAIMTAVDYWHTREALRVESRLSVSRILSTARRRLESAFEERRGALSLVLSENPYERLSSDGALAAKLRHLQDAFGGFVDLGVISSKGDQVSYSGPYDLKGRNYKGQDWFHEVVLRGTFLSEVFMGYRDFPHFIIGVRQKKGPDDFFILRATIDMAVINSRLYAPDVDRRTDAFIVSRDGVLQTDSALYGPALKKSGIVVPSQAREAEVLEEYREDGAWTTAGFAAIERTPFILVVVKRRLDPFGAWLGLRASMFWFLGVSIAMIFAVMLYSSNRIVSSLRQADARRARALHDLEYTNKLATIGRMAASVAHEINNPLAIINENAGLLKDMAVFSEDHPHKEKTLSLVQSIQKSVARCGEVTHRLLGFAKRMGIRREPMYLDKLLEEVAGFQKTEALHRNVRISYSFPGSVPAIESDRGQLQQVFLNILSNALAAVSDGGRIEIGLRQTGADQVAVSVADNGQGISEANIRHIFEPFFSTKGEFGTGLGLSITRDIVAKLGGTIGVESKPGVGTTFTVTLPIRSPA